MRYGIATGQKLAWPLLAERWRRWEALGFDSIWDFDHLIQPSDPEAPFYEGWTLFRHSPPRPAAPGSACSSHAAHSAIRLCWPRSP
jgi:hypothetical protein